jgi:hypothetical protein
MSKVIGLRGQEVSDPRKPREDVIRMAEDLLERAKSGEVDGFLAVLHYADEATGIMRAGLASCAMLGRLEIARAGLVDGLRS